MTGQQSQYETLLAAYSDRQTAIALLKQHRPYLSLVPSVRRPEGSLIVMPLPVMRHLSRNEQRSTPKTLILPCDLAILTCDPEWQIKLDAEIMVFIHRPGETFSELLLRWRHTQVYLDQDYEWLMPESEAHMISNLPAQIHPLFVVFPTTPEHIIKGLTGAHLPFVLGESPFPEPESVPEVFVTGN
ncbi:hypothetical protein FEK30_07605 [Picosynechococcus sp. PCC 11901]|uniref:hypothetical protein n=1 Tax=Picosynechococcus sp. PCC 11901 TaxID=2579791 RepID=UPI0010FC2D4D|nr:hypothetical protein [Picosynechococcus sp. PCC 11901]QCS49314.1 hypothetical protein FEK30_07605 [Picosynechococcus sp. PCC 11901]